MSQTVLITGCSTGMGKETAKKFLAEGWHVAATMRTPEREEELTALDSCLVTRLDVTDQASIDAAIAATKERFGDIGVVVNNAGYGGHALLEQSTPEFVEAMYATNVFGVMNVCRAVLPEMRRRRSGCIINVTSMGGLMGLPLGSAYCSSKFAVEGMTESLALECAPLNIGVHSVLPGAYNTNFVPNVVNQYEVEGDADAIAYATLVREHMQNITSGGGQKNQPVSEVADLVYACATDPSMPVHNPVGDDAQMLVGLMGNAPRQDFVEKMKAMLLPKAG